MRLDCGPGAEQKCFNSKLLAFIVNTRSAPMQMSKLSEWHSAHVLVSGDSPLMRSALVHLISGNGVAMVGECANHPDALRRAMNEAVDVVVMDLDLEAQRLSQTLRLEQLLAAAEGCPVLIVTEKDDRRAIVPALQKGLAGIVLKSRSADVLMRAIGTVLSGGSWLERSTMASMFHAADARDAVIHEQLTRRETQIVELVSLGLQNKKIAERLSITETTVRHHLTSIFDKLSVTNRLELMRYTYGGEPRGEIVPRD